MKQRTALHSAPVQTHEPQGIAYRSATINRAAIDEKRRTCEVTFATETPVRTWQGNEILRCDDQSADLSRLNSGGAVLSEHDRTRQIGVVERAWTENGKCRATLRFGRSDLAQQEWEDLKDGIRSQISVGFVVERYTAGKADDELVATRWSALEVSLVSIPADQNCGVGRAHPQHKTFRSNQPMNPTDTPAAPANNKRELERVKAYEWYLRNFPAAADSFTRIFEAGGSDSDFKAHVADGNLRRGTGLPIGEHQPLLTRGADGYGDPGTHQVRTIGDIIANNSEVRSLLDGGRRSVSFTIGVPSFRAALGTADIGGTIQHNGAPIVGPERVTAMDLFAQGSIAAGTLRYPREVSVSDAGFTAEGETKTEVVFDLDPIDSPVRKATAWTRLSTEMLEDAPQAKSYIETRLGGKVILAEEYGLLNGPGTGATLLGIANVSGVQAQAKGSYDLPETLRRGIGKVADGSDFFATGIAIHPNDWQRVELTRDANGQFLVGNVFIRNEMGRLIQAPSIWGLPVAVTKGVPEGTAIVGAFATAAQIFRRNGVTITASNTDADNLTKNLVTIIAEQRLVSAIYCPAAFVLCTGLNT